MSNFRYAATDVDFFGSIHRPKTRQRDGADVTITYVDLREFDDCHVVPISLPANLHFYGDETEINSLAFVVKSQKFASIDQIRLILSCPGIHYVLYVQIHDACFMLRWATIHPDTDEFDRSLIKKMPVSQRLSRHVVECSSLFPHTCPRCKGPAYVGFTAVDCSRKCYT